MKMYRYILLALLTTAFLPSCKEDELDPNSVIAKPAEANTAFDKWIYDNYTYPYNIAIKYKMQDIEASKGYDLAPAYPEKCEDLSRILQYIWLETFNEVRGVEFIREHSPKVMLMIGSWAHNTDGTIILGTAESGMKITLFGVNLFDAQNISIAQLQSYMKTVIHEFSHILHQKKMFDPEYERISSGNYVIDEWDDSVNSLALAYELGFVSRYARKDRNEDFVEMISIYMVYGEDYFNSILAQAGPSGAAKLTQKLTIVKDYLRDTWALDLDELNRVFTRRLNSVDMLNL